MYWSVMFGSAPGQSNMEFTVDASRNAAAEIAEANYPAIRHVDIANAISDKPLEDAVNHWLACCYRFQHSPFHGRRLFLCKRALPPITNSYRPYQYHLGGH